MDTCIFKRILLKLLQRKVSTSNRKYFLATRYYNKVIIEYLSYKWNDDTYHFSYFQFHKSTEIILLSPTYCKR